MDAELDDFFDESPIELEEEKEELVQSDDLFADSPIEDDLMRELLESRGIKDGKISILGEDGEEQILNFNELSKEEKLDILNGSISSEETNDYDLDTSEIELLNIIRNNNMTVNEFLEAYKENILSAVSGNNKEYTIDSYNDNELFLLDLKNKYDLSDSELEDELNKELSNPDIFAKKVSKIREEYKTLEDEYNKNELLVQENQRVEQYNQFVESMITVAQDTPELHGILLEDEEKNNILSYLAELDENGVSAFYKELNNPQRLYEAAWFLRYGKEAFDTLINAYESEIAKYKKDKPVKAVSRGHEEIKSIYDLH